MPSFGRPFLRVSGRGRLVQGRCRGLNPKNRKCRPSVGMAHAMVSGSGAPPRRERRLNWDATLNSPAEVSAGKASVAS